jgi:SAM-dependent methyltransferase
MQAPADWYTTFFTGIALDFWNAATTPEMTRAEADFIVKMLQLPQGAAILDVPCGNGRHSIELAARSYRLTGVDIAAENIATARASAAARNVDVVWRHAEMRDLSWVESFDGAFCFGNSFGYLDDEGNAAFLRAVARALKPGGRFIIDTGIVAEALLPILQERTWYECGGTIMLIRNQYDPGTSRLHTELTFVRDGAMVRRMISQRVYTYRELVTLLADAGFGQCDAFSSLTGEPYRYKASRSLLVAQKGAK